MEAFTWIIGKCIPHLSVFCGNHRRNGYFPSRTIALPNSRIGIWMKYTIFHALCSQLSAVDSMKDKSVIWDWIFPLTLGLPSLRHSSSFLRNRAHGTESIRSKRRSSSRISLHFYNNENLALLAESLSALFNELTFSKLSILSYRRESWILGLSYWEDFLMAAKAIYCKEDTHKIWRLSEQLKLNQFDFNSKKSMLILLMKINNQNQRKRLFVIIKSFIFFPILLFFL